MLISAPWSSPHHEFPPTTAHLPSPRSYRKGKHGLASGGRLSPPAAAMNGACMVAAVASPVGRRRCECFDLHQQLVSFSESWDRQQSIVERRKGLVQSKEDHSDTLIALQHPPVYTLGTGSSEEYLNFDIKDAPFEIHRTERGGEVTYHGPGQLAKMKVAKASKASKESSNRVCHEFINLIHRWTISNLIIRALRSEFYIKASRMEGLTGVWVGDQKVAAIGIKVEKWITYHGLALNVTTDLTPFQHIVPCGIKDHGVGSIKEILQMASGGREFSDAVLIDKAYKSLIKEFAEVFQLSLDLSPNWNLQESNNND